VPCGGVRKGVEPQRAQRTQRRLGALRAGSVPPCLHPWSGWRCLCHLCVLCVLCGSKPWTRDRTGLDEGDGRPRRRVAGPQLTHSAHFVRRARCGGFPKAWFSKTGSAAAVAYCRLRRPAPAPARTFGGAALPDAGWLLSQGPCPVARALQRACPPASTPRGSITAGTAAIVSLEESAAAFLARQARSRRRSTAGGAAAPDLTPAGAAAGCTLFVNACQWRKRIIRR
jgi:hypothetical protein